MAETNNTPSPYPIAYGNEEEMSFRLRGSLDVIEAPEFRVALSIYRSRLSRNLGIVTCGNFDSTGGVTYVDKDHMERSSPTYTSPADLADRIQYNEVFAVDYATILAQGRDEPGTRIGINRRNIDSHGHTFANHVNMAVRSKEKDALKAKIWSMAVCHALTKGVVVGAGYNGSHGVYFAQKVNRIGGSDGRMDTYGYTNSAFRVTQDEGTTRVEFRSGDTHVSWDSTLRQIGLDGIALSIAQTPLTANLGSFFIKILENPKEIAPKLNRIPVGRTGEFVPTKAGYADTAVCFQMKMCELFMSEAMKKYGDQPPELMAIAEDAYLFGEVMREVLQGNQPVSALARRGSDWAAKQMITAARLRKDRADKKPRSLGDTSYRRDDLGYDYMEVTLLEDGEVDVAKVGLGYVLRDREKFFPTYRDPETIREAGLTAPSDTRDGLRASLMTEYVPTAAAWHYLYVLDRAGNERAIRVNMPDVLMTTLGASMLGDLCKAKKAEPAKGS